MIIIQEIRPEDQELMEQTAFLEQQIFTDAWSYHEIRSTVKQRHSFCAAAKEGDTVLGYYLCYYVLDECEIARIAVVEPARRRGVGQQLFDHMEAVCREKQLTKILLDVRKSNEPAAAFYKKNGFVIDGERRFYYGGSNPEDAVLMSKRIGAM